MQHRFLLFSLLLFLLLNTPAWAAKPADYEREQERFRAEMVAKHGVSEELLARTVDAAVYKQSIIDAMTRPAEGKPWHEYRKIFLTSKRINGGVAFWREHRDLLERAQQRYGVPPEVIVAIIGVETWYGGYTGSYRVIDALATLGFGYPKRAKFFRGELEEFLLLLGEQDIDPAKIKGSYAGAMGLGQFIPSSYRAYAVDFDGDGRIDLLNSVSDAIGSVANYLHRHGWRPGMTITSEADGANASHSALVEAGMKPSFSLEQLARQGITPRRDEVICDSASLIRLDGEQGDEYWLGCDNFYVITRYNHSNLYAMAVTQLSEAIHAGYTGAPSFDLRRPEP
jgi:membrane-bound lytic murein transglycosylase B